VNSSLCASRESEQVSIGESRLGAWEAVVFGASHVESALALVWSSSLLEGLVLATETAVEMLVLSVV
jgi:hypothetical protein